MFSFAGKPLRHATCLIWEGMGETHEKVVESSNKCFICSSIPTSKNKVYIFRKTSTDLAGIIRSSLEFDVERNTTKTVICLFADSVFSS